MESWHTVQTRARWVAGWATALLGFSLPISTSLDGILLVIIVIAWTISGIFSELPKIVRENWLVLLLPGTFVLLALGMVHGLVPFDERVRRLWKYDDLLFPLMFVSLFVDPDVRERGLWAFGLGMGVTLFISLGLAIGWVPKSSWFHGDPSNATVFRHQVTHNVLMAFAGLLFLEVAIRQQVLWKRCGLSLLAACAAIDVFMLVKGRTGQAILSGLIVLWCTRRFGVRGVFAGAAAVVILVALSYSVSPVFQERVQITIAEMQQAQVDVVASEESSIGLRVEWYKNSMQLIAAHPLIGVGTGSFAKAYGELVTEPKAILPTHPHNQYLLAYVELGVFGAGLMLGLFGLLWWKFRRSGGHFYGELGQGVVLVMAIGCVFNSLLVDHTEGLFFAWIISAILAADHIDGVAEPC